MSNGQGRVTRILDIEHSVLDILTSLAPYSPSPPLDSLCHPKAQGVNRSHTPPMNAPDDTTAVRLDQWLWAARFYKTRSMASEAISGGKIHLNGHRAKRAKQVRVGDEVRVRKGPFEQLVVVRGLAHKRGPAKIAQTLYEETAESLYKREELALHLKSQPETSFRTKGRPTKRERREIDRLKRRR